MTDRLQEIRERLDKATPGPWENLGCELYPTWIVPYPGDVGSEVIQTYEDSGGGIEVITDLSNEDADLIANAPTDVAHLLEQVADLTARLDAYEGMRQELAETLDAVRGLHKPFRIYDECGHGHLSEGEPGVVEAEGVGLTCADGFMYEICGHCCVGGGGGQSEECATEHDHGADKPICATASILCGGES